MRQWKSHWRRFNLSDTEVFLEACVVAAAGPSNRQRARWNRKEGRAYKKRTTARRRLTQARRRLEGSL